MYIISIPKVFKPTNQRNCYFLKFWVSLQFTVQYYLSPCYYWKLSYANVRIKKYYEKENKTNATSKKMCLVTKNDTLHKS